MIVWLYHKDATEAASGLAKALGEKGYPIEPRPVLTGQKWEELNLKTVMSQKPWALFLTGLQASHATDLVENARAASLEPLFGPVLWAYEAKERSILRDLGKLAVDDFFPLTTPVDEVISRLEMRRHEQLLRVQKSTAQHEQRLESVKNETVLKQREEFLSVCAHDLRSPLGLIQSSISLVLNTAKENALNAQQVELLTRAKRQSGQALQLVKDLLDVMAFEQGLRPQYKLLNLHQVLDEFYRDYSAQAEGKRVSFHYENPVKDWRIFADADRIRQLLQNLFTNALKFTESGKNIYLSVSPFTGRRKTDPRYPMLVMHLKDEGPGIPQKEMQRIFDRFSQIKDYSRSEGRGLGLTVAKQISTLHDGNIWVQSEEGKGATFSVLMPHVVSRSETNQGTPRSILIVEPSPLKRDVYYKELESWGWKVTFARDGVEGLSLAFHDLPEVILLTSGLPKVDESEIAKILKSDPIASSVRVVLAEEPGEAKTLYREDKYFDVRLKLPLTAEALENLGSKKENGSERKSRAQTREAA